MNWSSVLFGAAVGIVVGIPVARHYRAGKFTRGLAVFGILAGGGIAGGLKALISLGDSFDVPIVLVSYAVTVALIVVLVLIRGAPPREAEMTPEQWKKLTSRQRIILRKRLDEGMSSKEVADDLGMTEDQVNQEFLRALESAQE